MLASLSHHVAVHCVDFVVGALAFVFGRFTFVRCGLGGILDFHAFVVGADDFQHKLVTGLERFPLEKFGGNVNRIAGAFRRSLFGDRLFVRCGRFGSVLCELVFWHRLNEWWARLLNQQPHPPR